MDRQVQSPSACVLQTHTYTHTHTHTHTHSLADAGRQTDRQSVLFAQPRELVLLVVSSPAARPRGVAGDDDAGRCAMWAATIAAVLEWSKRIRPSGVALVVVATKSMLG